MSPGVDYLSTFNNVMVVGEIKMGKYVSLVRKVQKVNAVRPGYRYQYEYIEANFVLFVDYFI